MWAIIVTLFVVAVFVVAIQTGLWPVAFFMGMCIVGGIYQSLDG